MKWTRWTTWNFKFKWFYSFSLGHYKNCHDW